METKIRRVREEARKRKKAERLIAIVCKKKNNGFRLHYYFSAKKGKIDAFSTDIGKKEKVNSISGIFPSALIYEQEINELFGVEFKGNEKMGKRLFIAEGMEHAHPMGCPLKGEKSA